jgi:heme/copper-type cytochrome/quinol oxidase subunit 3
MTSVTHASPTRVTAKPNGWWGMLVFLAAEATLFGMMIGSYFYLRLNTAHWPPAATPAPKVAVPALLTVGLLCAAVPLQASLTAARRSRQAKAVLLLATATLVQAAYLAVQVQLYADSLRQFKPQASAYASIYYTLLAAGHFHVLVGLLLNVWLLLRLGNRLTPYRVAGLRVTTLYWHIVNALTVLVLLTEISPRL